MHGGGRHFDPWSMHGCGLLRSWYCLDIERENALAMLEGLQHMLPNGAFVVSNSRREFAMLTFIDKGNLNNIPIDADLRQVWLKIPNVKKPPRFKNLSSMVEHYSQKKQKGMGSKLNPYDLDKALNDVGQDEALLAELDCTSADAERGGALVNPGYHAVAPSRNPQGMANPGYIGNASGGIVSEYRVAVPAYAGSPGKTSGGYVFISPESPDHNGYIQISEKCFTTDEGIVGVTFQPCQQDEWFFMGVSNINDNHHGKRDQHYDDMDYCIGVMGHGKASARENEDEVGPYVEYKAGDTFTIKVNKKKSCVEFAKNKKVFHTSFMPLSKLPLWALQAFHPVNGGQTLIRNSSWLASAK
eukprot:m.1202457 g.1202457  ORF g.1202457 m.1202457 type:complete len:357 (+) comp24576_c0_seq59:1024-2094(+)